MLIGATARSWRTSLAWSALSRAARLLTFGFFGWLWLFPRAEPAWRAVSLVAVLTIAALVGGTWYLALARAESRWRVALDRYASRELEKETPSRSDSHGPQSKVR